MDPKDLKVEDLPLKKKLAKELLKKAANPVMGLRRMSRQDCKLANGEPSAELLEAAKTEEVKSWLESFNK